MRVVRFLPVLVAITVLAGCGGSEDQPQTIVTVTAQPTSSLSSTEQVTPSPLTTEQARDSYLKLMGPVETADKALLDELKADSRRVERVNKLARSASEKYGMAATGLARITWPDGVVSDIDDMIRQLGKLSRWASRVAKAQTLVEVDELSIMLDDIDYGSSEAVRIKLGIPSS